MDSAALRLVQLVPPSGAVKIPPSLPAYNVVALCPNANACWSTWIWSPMSVNVVPPSIDLYSDRPPKYTVSGLLGSTPISMAYQHCALHIVDPFDGLRAIH